MISNVCSRRSRPPSQETGGSDSHPAPSDSCPSVRSIRIVNGPTHTTDPKDDDGYIHTCMHCRYGSGYLQYCTVRWVLLHTVDGSDLRRLTTTTFRSFIPPIYILLWNKCYEISISPCTYISPLVSLSLSRAVSPGRYHHHHHLHG